MASIPVNWSDGGLRTWQPGEEIGGKNFPIRKRINASQASVMT